MAWVVGRMSVPTHHITHAMLLTRFRLAPRQATCTLISAHALLCPLPLHQNIAAAAIRIQSSAMPRKRTLSTTVESPPVQPAHAAKKHATRSSARAATAGRESVRLSSVVSEPAESRPVTQPHTKTTENESGQEKEEEAKPGYEEESEPRRYWLMKAEPETRIEKGKDVKFSIDDLAACDEPQAWDGVRNYGARNNLKSMKEGDLAFFYHSNCKTPGIVGIMRVVRSASVDETAFDPNEPYYDPKSDPAAPKWFLVHVSFVRKFARTIGLHELKTYAGTGEPLAMMPLLKQGRLSVSEVPKVCWDFVLGLEGKEEEKQ